MITLFTSSALTARALLFCSKIVSVSVHWPALNIFANTALASMFVASIAKLKLNSYTARQCEKRMQMAE